MTDIRDDEGAAREPFGWAEVALGDEEIERRAAEMDRARREEVRRFSQPLPQPFPRPREEPSPPPPAAAVPPARGGHRVLSALVLAAVVAGVVAVRVASPHDPPPPPEPLPIPRLPPLPRVPPLPPEHDPPVATGKVRLVVQVTTDGGASGRFTPDVVRVNRGDVLRFVTDGVAAHNVSFVSADDPGEVPLPPTGPYLTTPGQTYEMVVELEPGIYTFRCDPHETMGEVGTLIVDP